jgi:hypothetical protein
MNGDCHGNEPFAMIAAGTVVVNGAFLLDESVACDF